MEKKIDDQKYLQELSLRISASINKHHQITIINQISSYLLNSFKTNLNFITSCDETIEYSNNRSFFSEDEKLALEHIKSIILHQQMIYMNLHDFSTSVYNNEFKWNHSQQMIINKITSFFIQSFTKSSNFVRSCDETTVFADAINMKLANTVNASGISDSDERIILEQIEAIIQYQYLIFLATNV